ncbi:pyrroline-5-carboxylate reductase [Demequina pelophila]|uniref:pyrroline-5-carboxylate reductase n=1 Tax=Demequina pelophila TaxID=1638984 RepID=UPI00078665D8|nr:pyrroline-5-carboxylate reductase [Demequina pelophila]
MSEAATTPTTLPSIAVVGAGVMGGTMIAALRAAGWPGTAITVAEHRPERRAELVSDHGVRLADDAPGAVADADVVILAVKPQQMGEVLDAIGASVSPAALVLTVAAALPASFYEERLMDGIAVVRAMPNTPSIVGRGATSISPGAHATEEHLALVERMLAATGLVVRVDEPLIEAVTVVAGSAPAYYYAIVEAVVEAGVMQGLDRDVAVRMAQQTFIGAGALLEQSGDTPAHLRERVSSPGGTTLAALKAMEHAGLQGVISAGANAAVARSRQLGVELAG